MENTHTQQIDNNNFALLMLIEAEARQVDREQPYVGCRIDEGFAMINASNYERGE
jgi:hypothetical protein